MPTRQHILIIDDEESLRHMLTAMLTRQGYRCESAANGAEALEAVRKNIFDYILCDIRMPEMDGKKFLLNAIREGVTSPIIMMSAYGTLDTAVECMKKGAYDFISKPFKKDEIVLVLKKAEERERLKEENLCLRDRINGNFQYDGVMSRNPAMEEIFNRIRKVADLKTTALILGESGTGKELAARAIHRNGSRVSGPFVAVNCGAIPENLLESELFGHVRGAFTGATADKAGLFEQADGGTLFLDEIGEMPLSLQVKLLRVLQEGEIRRIGATAPVSIDARIISATSRDLESDVQDGCFREDLYFRLNVFCLKLPALRERTEDIPLLAEHFLSLVPRRPGEGRLRIEPGAMRSLMAYHWPGNIRELENAVQHAAILCENGAISKNCFPEPLRSAHFTPQFPDSTEAEDLSIKRAENAIERDLIRKALARTSGNRTQAAKILEISHRSLLYKLKEYEIE